MSLESIVLRDPNSGSTAKVLPGFGFNCYSFAPVVSGEAIETLWAAADFDSGQQRASHSGIPLLFPFPGRLGGTEFRYAGKSYSLDAADGRGNAIHGFVLNRPWEVVERTETRLVGQFQASQVEPGILDHWPADFRITLGYELRGSRLSSAIEIFNPDDKPLPFGFGMHPYFRVPLGQRGRADDCLITVPVTEYWPLENMLPTGQTLPAVGPRDLARGMRFADAQLDDVFSGLPSSAASHAASIVDPGSGRTLRLTFGQGFNAVVVYNPPHREAVCIEPYTCIPDYFNLMARGIDARLNVLKPGETATLSVAIELM